jgi:hypothetical protein
MIPLGLLRGTFANMNMGPKANRMPYVFTNPSKETELFSCDRVFVLATTPQRATDKVDMKEWLLDIQMQKARQQKETTAKFDQAGITAASGSIYSPTKGLESFDKAHRILEDRVFKMSMRMNQKLDSIITTLEQMLPAKVDYFGSSVMSDASPTARSIESHRSRFNSIDTIGSQQILSASEDPQIEPIVSIAEKGGNDPKLNDTEPMPPITRSLSQKSISGKKTGVTFLQRVIELADNSEVESVDTSETSIVTMMESAVVDKQSKQELPMIVQDLSYPETQALVLPVSTPGIAKEVTAKQTPKSTEQPLQNPLLSPSQIFNLTLPQISSSVLIKKTIESRSGPSVVFEAIHNSSIAAVAPTSPIDSISSPDIMAVANRIVPMKLDGAAINTPAPSSRALIPGPSVDVINIPSTDRVAKIRSLKIRNGPNALNCHSRPFSANGSAFEIYTSPFDDEDDDGSQTTNGSFYNSNRKRERASSAHR